MGSTEETPLIHDEQTGGKRDPLDEPFSVEERIAYPVTLSLLPWVGYMPIMYLVALIRVYPDRPWFTGLWLAPLVLTVSYLTFWSAMVRHPRIVRDALQRSWSYVHADHPAETQREKIARRLQIVFLVSYCCVSSYDAALRSDFPIACRAIGCVMVISSFVLGTWVVLVNKRASTILLAKAPDRYFGQKLATTGPYSIVRHPVYMDWIIYSLGMPLVIGSYWGLIPSVLTIPLCMWRTADDEERMTKQYGADFDEYKEKVKSKIIPGVF